MNGEVPVGYIVAIESYEIIITFCGLILSMKHYFLYNNVVFPKRVFFYCVMSELFFVRRAKSLLSLFISFFIHTTILIKPCVCFQSWNKMYHCSINTFSISVFAEYSRFELFVYFYKLSKIFVSDFFERIRFLK